MRVCVGIWAKPQKAITHDMIWMKELQYSRESVIGTENDFTTLSYSATHFYFLRYRQPDGLSFFFLALAEE